MYGKILKAVHRLREHEGQETKEIPDELITVEKRIDELNAKLARQKAINPGSYTVQKLAQERGNLVQRRNKLIKQYGLKE